MWSIGQLRHCMQYIFARARIQPKGQGCYAIRPMLLDPDVVYKMMINKSYCLTQFIACVRPKIIIWCLKIEIVIVITNRDIKLFIQLKRLNVKSCCRVSNPRLDDSAAKFKHS